jgi:YgiT-type zinc finger domain-containing protein
MKMTTQEVCEFCDGKVEPRIIQARFRFQGHTIYVDGVPAWVCVKCGEQYFDAPVYKRLEEIARQNSRIKKTICFPLAEYDMVLA